MLLMQMLYIFLTLVHEILKLIYLISCSWWTGSGKHQE